MSETEKSTLIKLDEHQFQHLLVAVGGISREIGKLESRLALMEGELKLIRIEMKEFQKKK